MSTDLAWDRWGRDDPYFGVLTDAKFRKEHLTEQSKAEFFESGALHVRHVLAVCKKHIDPDFSPQRILDFGCGVGRLVIPFAKLAQQVVGLDVSEHMLKEAHLNCTQRAVANVTLLKSDDALSAVEGSFDLIHSYIVFQHIPPDRGKQPFQGLLRHLRAGGIGVFHFTYRTQDPATRDAPSASARLRVWLRRGGRKARRIIDRLFSKSTSTCRRHGLVP